MDLIEQERVWAEIDLDALSENYRYICRVSAARTVMPVIKADGYGHGAAWVARALLEVGAGYFAVATGQEALSLRKEGVRVPILVLGAVFGDMISELARQDVSVCVYDRQTAERYRKALGKGRIRVHVKVDTGMRRLGMDADSAAELILELCEWDCFEVEGCFTHFASAGDADKSGFTEEQYRTFKQVEQRLCERLDKPPLFHCSNSDAVTLHPEFWADLSRPGIMLYGYGSGAAEVTPVLSLKARIAQVRSVKAGESVSYSCSWTAPAPSRIAVISAGYADGLLRTASGKAHMLVHETKVPQVGRICMDMCMIDVTGAEGVCAGDVVTIIGRDGDERLSAEDFAKAAGTIPYEVLTSLGTRVPRYYFKGGVLAGRMVYGSRMEVL